MKSRFRKVFVALGMFIVATPSTLLGADIFTNPNDFEAAIFSLGVPTIIDFEEIDASPVNNTFVGRDPFDGMTFVSEGITFSNPNDVPLFIAPGGLFWNASNSLSVGQFPFDDNAADDTDDDLVVTLNRPAAAVGFTLVDNFGSLPGEFVQFIDLRGNLVAQVMLPVDFTNFRAFVGIVSVDRPIRTINIVEAANDGDDVNYDDFIWLTAPIFVDIKPGSDPNAVNPRSKGVIPVAVLGSVDFDAMQVDFSTVGFGPDEASPVHDGHVENVNGDGFDDMVFHFKVSDTGIACGDTDATLTGETFGGDLITGTDAVKTAGCK